MYVLLPSVCNSSVFSHKVERLRRRTHDSRFEGYLLMRQVTIFGG